MDPEELRRKILGKFLNDEELLQENEKRLNRLGDTILGCAPPGEQVVFHNTGQATQRRGIQGLQQQALAQQNAAVQAQGIQQISNGFVKIPEGCNSQYYSNGTADLSISHLAEIKTVRGLLDQLNRKVDAQYAIIKKLTEKVERMDDPLFAFRQRVEKFELK